MKITFLGAAGVVTGSCYLIETDQATILLDCGMFQGPRELEALNWENPCSEVKHIDAVLLTHAHLDHSGRLPLLVRHMNYANPVYATAATIDLAKIILEDSARINASDTERENRDRAGAGLEPIEPFYDLQDTAKLLSLMQPVPYEEPFDVAPGITAQLVIE